MVKNLSRSPEQKLPPEAESSRIDHFLKFTSDTKKWLSDYFQGLPPQEQEPDEQTRDRRLADTVKIKLAHVGRFFGVHLPLDIPAYLAQRLIFKPREREAIADTLRGEQSARSSLQAIETRINASKHLTPEMATELLNDIWALSDDELGRINWEDLVNTEILGTEWTAESETKLGDDFVTAVEGLVENHVQTTLDGKQLLIDAVLTALVFKGGKLLKPLGTASKKAYMAIKTFKAGKAAKKTVKDLKAIWGDSEEPSGVTST
jgi:hypothetical protein